MAGFFISTAGITSAGVVSHWPGDRNSLDRVGKNHGTLEGDAKFQTSGQFGHAFSLDGLGGNHPDRVEIADSDALDVGTEFSWSTWFRSDVPMGDGITRQLLMHGFTDTAGKNNLLYVDDESPKLSFCVRDQCYGFHGTTDLSPGIWYHGAVAYDGTMLRLYLDGAEEIAAPKSMNLDANSRVIIGGYTNPATGYRGTGFAGQIDDVVLYDEALDADEIKCLFDLGSTETLNYSASEFDALKQAHDAGSGTVQICDLAWEYSSTLSAEAGLSGSRPDFTLVFDDTPSAGSRTGLISAEHRGGNLGLSITKAPESVELGGELVWEGQVTNNSGSHACFDAVRADATGPMDTSLPIFSGRPVVVPPHGSVGPREVPKTPQIPNNRNLLGTYHVETVVSLGGEDLASDGFDVEIVE